jgi:endonuclease/exonuclease/phosphatase family metal-dependent hydrolase
VHQPGVARSRRAERKINLKLIPVGIIVGFGLTWLHFFWISLAVVCEVSAFAIEYPPEVSIRFVRKHFTDRHPLGMSLMDHEDDSNFPWVSGGASEDPDLEDYCEVVDEFGLTAFENVCEGNSEDADDFKRIRLEKQSDECLKNIVTQDDIRRKIAEVRLEQARYGLSDLYLREWESTNGQATTDSKSVVSVMQFNALAEGLSSGPTAKKPFQINSPEGRGQNEKQVYGGFSEIPVPSVSLDFGLRRWRLLEVILGTMVSADSSSSCDLIALQEIDRYRGFFAPIMRLFGYEGIFKPKPRSPGVRMGWYSDGCCLFWKKETFELISERRLDFKVGSQIMMVALLRHKPSGKKIAVAVTHLKAQNSKPNEMIRCRQVDELLEQIDDVVESATEHDDIKDVLVLGDFNADPPCNISSQSSSVGRMLARQLRSLSSSTEPVHLRSSYKIDPPANSFFTTWKTRGPSTSRRVIDYILYAGRLRCTETLRMPKEEDLEGTKLPGLQNPSDHMMIAAKFEL